MTSPFMSSSSGSLLADRRLSYARALQADGDPSAAADLIEQALALIPDWPPGWFLLGEAREAAGLRTAAAQAYSRALSLAPDDPFGASLRLARLHAAPSPNAAPPAHVRALFDEYAPRFETSLLEGLAYKAPALLRAALEPLPSNLRILDLGCGTGLAGQAFAETAERLVGIDLSPAMLAQAKAKNIYDHLEQAEAAAWLAATTERFDVILAADVLVYIGDLGPIFAEVRRALASGGRFAFTVEAGDIGFSVGESLRYRHGRDYIEEALDRSGLSSLKIERASLRHDAGAPVEGFVVTAKRNGR